MIWMGLVADFKDPNDIQERSYRQINAERTHVFPIGALVEIESGYRLSIVRHYRDCDLTPLYALGINDVFLTGYTEESLTIIVLPEEREQK